MRWELIQLDGRTAWFRNTSTRTDYLFMRITKPGDTKESASLCKIGDLRPLSVGRRKALAVTFLGELSKRGLALGG